MAQDRAAPEDGSRWRIPQPSGLLLANGYDPNGDGDSPLSEAVRSRNHTMVGLLLKYVTDPKGIK